MYKIYNKDMKSNPENLKPTITEFMDRVNVSIANLKDDIKFDLKVILNELLINAIKHGNNSEINKDIKIIAGLSNDNCIIIVIEDRGDGYNFKKVAKTYCAYMKDKENSDEIMENGRGILIVRSLCDRVRVNAKGNQVIVVKKLS